ncbi:neuritin-like protein [Ursus maritimus]|uniref:Neuritin-like protein n=1 Tax=Ursus maritimus TaxID=29073 RepID=A0A384D202_URSMA|nr:neuritin-like protein [Ursus maritimus]XP_026349490.1 neuritin-like protein [Ursus arctos]
MMHSYCSCHHRQRLPRLSGVLGLLLLLLPLGKQAPGGLVVKGGGAARPINHSPPPPLVLVSPLAAAATGPGGCDTIYQGFAECLIRLGDSMGLGSELETVCRAWNDFHVCASRVLLRCPEEAATVWESLQQEARRAPHPDNLHALCRTPVRIKEHGTGPETNQETLQARASAPTPAPMPSLLAAALALTCLLGPLA